MSSAYEKDTSVSGLTSEEAREFHKIFLMGFIIFTLIAIVAHFLVWQWRPWLPSVSGYSMLDGVHGTVSALVAHLA